MMLSPEGERDGSRLLQLELDALHRRVNALEKENAGLISRAGCQSILISESVARNRWLEGECEQATSAVIDLKARSEWGRAFPPLRFFRSFLFDSSAFRRLRLSVPRLVGKLGIGANRLFLPIARYWSARFHDRSIYGCFDGIEGNRLRGWVWNSRKPDESIEVRVLIGKRTVLTQAANVFRPDLAEALGSGNHGYEIKLAPDIIEAARRPGVLVTLKVVGAPFETLQTLDLEERERTGRWTSPGAAMSTAENVACEMPASARLICQQLTALRQ